MADPNTVEETIALLSAIASEKGDSFRIKVQRKRSMAALPEVVALFEEGQVEHLATPETWLPRFAGGGIYMLTAYHAEAKNKPVGGVITVNVTGAPFDQPDLGALKDGWRGPSVLMHPAPAPERKESIAYTIPPAAGNGVVPRPDPGLAAARGISPEALQAAQIAEELRRREIALLQKEKEIEIASNKRDADRDRREMQAKIDRMEAEFRMRSTTPTAPTGPTAAEVVATVMQSLTPLVSAFMQATNQSKLEMQRLQIESNNRLAELQSSANAKAAEQNQMLLQSILTRPAIDPVVQALLQKEDPSQGAAINHMVEAMGMMSQTTLNMVSAAAELGVIGGGQQESEPVALKALKEGIKAVMALNGGFAKAQTPRRRVAPRRAPAPAPAPTAPPVAIEPQVLQAAEPDVIDEIVDLIRSKKLPAEEAASTILEMMLAEQGQLEAALVAVGGDFGELFYSRLGGWMDQSDENREYAQETFLLLIRQGNAKGFIPDSILEQAEAQILGDEEDEVEEDEVEEDEDEDEVEG